MSSEPEAVDHYFSAMRSALSALKIFLSQSDSPLSGHALIAQVVLSCVERLMVSFDCFQDRIEFVERFRIARAESGFPAFQSVLALDNDRKSAAERLAAIPDPNALRHEMADFILRHRAFPHELRKQMAERIYLERIGDGEVFAPFFLPETIRVSVNPKTMRPYYVVYWSAFDGTANLPIVYMATIEDSSPALVRQVVDEDGRLKRDLNIPLPVGGLLNPDLANAFDAFAQRNSAYTLSLATIAGNLDRDFDTLHPKQLRRFVLGPFYAAGITEHNETVSALLNTVRNRENAWVLTWTIQEIFSKAEQPGRKGLWSSQPAREQFHIETSDLEAARQGVSHYEKHALVPHDAYQALYATGEANDALDGFKVHVFSRNQVISGV